MTKKWITKCKNRLILNLSFHKNSTKWKRTKKNGHSNGRCLHTAHNHYDGALSITRRYCSQMSWKILQQPRSVLFRWLSRTKLKKLKTLFAQKKKECATSWLSAAPFSCRKRLSVARAVWYYVRRVVLVYFCFVLFCF